MLLAAIRVAPEAAYTIPLFESDNSVSRIPAKVPQSTKTGQTCPNNGDSRSSKIGRYIVFHSDNWEFRTLDLQARHTFALRLQPRSSLSVSDDVLKTVGIEDKRRL
ncbi:hypothetical protein RvY_06983 [Ramazzottius varieornatus]|uniref:Uncharacterized protein n=1 Tax=Ramazzottius varieornatus TaxID=947166 RepID=A0A1D1V5Q1_RAMVA|nr:hypothetical protein RvY_06983 [Ramazzottius varieornatus]